MSKLSGGASYLSKESVPAKRVSTQKKSPVMVVVSAFFALLVLFMSAQPLMASLSNPSTTTSHMAEAGSPGFTCTSKIGLWMDDKSDWASFLKVYPLADEKNRVWTLQEAFGNGATFVNYEGEGGKEKEWVIEKSPENTTKPGNYDAVADKLNGARSVESCVYSGLLTSVANFGLLSASAISNVVQMFVVFAFDSNIICNDPANPSGACLNLLKVIGGTGDTNGGLIGTLTSSIYMPLLVIAVTVTGLWIGYKGLVQRKLREAMFSAIWVCLSVIFGLALLLNPALLAKAPMAVSNAVATCVIGSFNGQNCMDNSSGTASLQTDNFSTSSDKICRSIAPGAALDAQMSMTVNSLTCSIWKAFVLEPYAQGSFGTSFGNLDTVADTSTKKVVEKAGLDPNTFCVNLGSSESLSSFEGKRAVFDRDSGKVCNLLAYQMFLKTNAATTGSDTPSSGNIDPRWYNVIVTSANDEGLWAQWAPSFTNSLHKNATATLAWITAFVGGIVLVVISFFALVYYLTSVILMAFAPLFFLMGVHPGRGKKILLGWFEKVVSNILKYLASAIFLILSISFYAAILGSASNPALTFLFVIIITGALLMYRKEIVELIGKTSMGGEQLSSKFSDGLKARAAGVGGLALAGAGAGLGAKIAGGRVSSGIKAGIQRDLQRGGANKVFGKVGGELVGNVARQYARNTVDNERDVKEASKKAQADHAIASQELLTVSGDQEQAVSAVASFDAQLYNEANTLDELNVKKTIVSSIEDETAREMSAENPNFAMAQQLLNQINALEFDKKLALDTGDIASADRMTAQIEQLTGQRETLLGTIDSDELTRNRAEYDARLEDKMFRAKVDYSDDDESARLELTKFVTHAQSSRDELVTKANELIDRRNALEFDAATSSAQHETLNRLATDIQPGDNLTKKKTDAMLDQGIAAGQEAGNRSPYIASLDANRSVEDVYNEQRRMNYGGPSSEGTPPEGPFGPTDGGGPSGPTSGPQFPSGPADPTPTTPVPNVPPAGNPTERIPTQPERTSGIPTQPDRSPGIPTQPDRAPSVPTQPTQSPVDASPGVPTQSAAPSVVPAGSPSETLGRTAENYNGMATPFPQPEQQPTGLPTSPDRQPTVGVNDAAPVYSTAPAQPDRAPSVPSQPEYAPQVQAQPVSAPYVPTQPNREPQVQAPAPQPERIHSAPAQPVRAPSVPAQPEYSPSVPAQPVQGPSAPIQAAPVAPTPVYPAVAPEASRPSGRRAEGVPPEQPSQPPRIPTQPQSAPTVQQESRVEAPQPQATPAPAPVVAPTPVPAQPAQPPRIPTQPNRAPAPAPESRRQETPRPTEQPVQEHRVSAQPQSAPVASPTPVPAQPSRVPTQPNRAPAPATAPEPRRQEPRVEPPRSQAAPPAPTRDPAIPARPERAPSASRSQNDGERQVPLAREIRLPSAPRVSRITENSEAPSVSIQRENSSDNESSTRGFGLPRRRNSRND